jgi:uncharacterized coiled-coil DUF342 family protein
MQIDTGTVFTVLSLVLAAGTFFIGRVTAARNRGASDGELKSDIKHIKESQEELKENVKQYGMNYTEVREELAKLKGRLEKLEKVVEMYHNMEV